MKEKNKFVNENIGLVCYVIKRHFNYKPKSLSNLRLTRQDLFQQGKLGLIEASRKYDKEKGKFSTFAYGYIRNYIIKLISNSYKHISYVYNIDNVNICEDMEYIDIMIDFEKCCDKCLSDFQIKIVYEYIFEGYTFEEIAVRNNLNDQMNVIREYYNSIDKLKNYIKGKEKNKCI